jgi:dephospho-CoA kinase
LSIVDGEIDKSELAKIIFSNKSKLKILENILRPLVVEDFENWCKINSENEYIIFESAIIYETNSENDFDYIIAVSAPENIRINRVMKRNTLSREDVLNVMKNQYSDSFKCSSADYIIVNEGVDLVQSHNDLKEQVKNIDYALLSK